MRYFKKIIAGGASHRTRFHTERGELIPMRELRHLPSVLLGKLSSLTTGGRRDEPWWPMSVIDVVEKHLTSSSSVVEFGSGGSTPWLAARARHVTSIESNEQWYRLVAKRLEEMEIRNVNLRLAEGDAYFDAVSYATPEGFDLAIIDGDYRWRCVEEILPFMRNGGLVYLDNSDSDKDRRYYDNPEMSRCAQQAMERFALENPLSELMRLVSLINGEVQAGEGMILQVVTSAKPTDQGDPNA